jgi:hypothetical protein
MMNITNKTASVNERIEKYIDKIESIPEGQRNAVLPKKEYCITASADMVPVAGYLEKEVSAFYVAKSTKTAGTYTIGDFIETVRTVGEDEEDKKFLELIAKIRSETDKEERNKLKMPLTAITASSEPVKYRKADNYRFNGIICLDFDNIPPDKLEKAKKEIAKVPYIFAVALSVSGTGLLITAVKYITTPERITNQLTKLH